MSLITKPFDDSGVEMVDEIAHYGTAISKRLEQFRSKRQLRHDTPGGYSGIVISASICSAMGNIIERSNQKPFRAGYARAAQTLFFEHVSPDTPSIPATVEDCRSSPELLQVINTLLADDQVLPADGSVSLQTVMMALVWSALTFAMESLPPEQARSYVQQQILNGDRESARH
ncbi:MULTISPECIES: hypothetical protein [Marinobacter]|jgi:hypothetical protein|uniref:hypothetical protein n=1 Tax=Marinobacter TaxID=2742 RepID=UPI0007D9B0FD|nr:MULTISPECIES: hypothetical protein [unclassified Marinobacter]MBL3826697.1 hypothetical protein [Marinobacter sp. MC3]MBL3895094.1 hypothetical protein [Marinobacter sp. MW3]OAN93356.1 hypothetical protein A8B80_17495 [Marinobacter sp. EhN04]OAN94365.1 hypothetical protein A8B84_19925 [Marinobacter sp. EhC06]